MCNLVACVWTKLDSSMRLCYRRKLREEYEEKLDSQHIEIKSLEKVIEGLRRDVSRAREPAETGEVTSCIERFMPLENHVKVHVCLYTINLLIHSQKPSCDRVLECIEISPGERCCPWIFEIDTTTNINCVVPDQTRNCMQVMETPINTKGATQDQTSKNIQHTAEREKLVTVLQEWTRMLIMEEN